MPSAASLLGANGVVIDLYPKWESVGWDITEYKKKFWTPDCIRLSNNLMQAKSEAWNHWLAGPPEKNPPRSEHPKGYVIIDECGFQKVFYEAGEDTALGRSSNPVRGTWDLCDPTARRCKV